MENALVLVNKARSAGALIFAQPNLETPPLYRAEITEIKSRPDEFHDMKQGKYMPNKAVVDRIGDAAGIDFLNSSCGVRSELRDDDIGKRTVFIGYAQGRTRLPDGSWRQSSVEEYEFDPLLRAKIEKERDGEAAVKSKYLEYAKVARQRASTGARVRVIRQLVGMPVTFSDAERNKPLVFSRIVQNTDYILGTKEGRMMAIAAATGVAGMLYGPHAAQTAPAALAVETEYEEPEMRPADDQQTAGLAAQALDDGFAEEAPADPERQKLIYTLTDYINSGTMNDAAHRKVESLIDDPNTPTATLKEYVDKLRAGMGLKKAAS
jgi:hypothetical protein